MGNINSNHPVNQNEQELNPLNHEPIENVENNNETIVISNNNNNIEFESIVDDGGEVIYAPPKVIQSPIIKCLLNIHPKSLNFEQNDLGLWRLSFLFDCEQDSEIQIYFSAKDVGEKNEFLFKPLKEGRFNSIIKVKKGYNIQVKQEWEDAINFSHFNGEELKYDIVAKRYPLIIVAKILGENGENGEYGLGDSYGKNLLMDDDLKKDNKSEMQINYFNISRKEEEITSHLLQQKILYNSHSYIVQEIYGVESTQGGECVVCMAEPRNVVVLPCRHMCLCVFCADIYRIKTNKCPICRGPSRSFIKVNDDKGDDEKDAPTQPSPPTSNNNTNNNAVKPTTNSFTSAYFDDDI